MAESTLRPLSSASPIWLTALTWLAPISLVVAEAVSIALSPPERDMGHLQKILYVHVPAAWTFSLAYLLVFIQSVRYLWTRDESADLLAAAGAEVGAVFTGLLLVIGSIWGKATWGVWWTWDARLTSTAILFLVYVGYLALRGFTDDPTRRATWSAAVGILGALNVPIVYMSVKWWRTLHQMPSSPGTIDPIYTWGLRANAFAFLFTMIVFIAHRYRTLLTTRLLEQRLDELALGQRARA